MDAVGRLLRLKSILGPKGPLPCSRSTFYEKVRSGEFPSPVRLSKRIVAWKEDDIRALVEKGASSLRKDRG